MRLRMFGATDKGLVRSNNQDAYYCNAEYGIAIVSDGMGGHKGGEVASELVVHGLRDAFLKEKAIMAGEIGAFLDRSLKAINNEILLRSEADENCRGMGATVNYVQFAGGSIAIGHAGDSRTYLVRSWKRPDGKIRFGMWCLTIDHNVGVFVERGLMIVGKDISAGHLTERARQRLMRGMGVGKDLKADLYFKELQEGDVFVTCSDGLHGYVSDNAILKALVSGPLAKSPERLIQLAHSVGAPDNVTVVVSAVSLADEPLVEPAGELFDKGPYYVRNPSGEFFGPYRPDEVVRLWRDGTYNLQSEICGPLGVWVFLKNKEKLFKVYPDFNSQAVRDLYVYFSPESVAGGQNENVEAPLAKGKISKSDAKSKISYSKYLFIAIILLIFIFYLATSTKLTLAIF